MTKGSIPHAIVDHFIYKIKENLPNLCKPTIFILFSRQLGGISYIRQTETRLVDLLEVKWFSVMIEALWSNHYYRESLTSSEWKCFRYFGGLDGLCLSCCKEADEHAQNLLGKMGLTVLPLTVNDFTVEDFRSESEFFYDNYA